MERQIHLVHGQLRLAFNANMHTLTERSSFLSSAARKLTCLIVSFHSSALTRSDIRMRTNISRIGDVNASITRVSILREENTKLTGKIK